MPNTDNKLPTPRPFRFDPVGRKLWRNDDLIMLSPKAGDLLALLLERQGEFVSKDEIFQRIWPDTFVEDGVLTQNIYTLRKVLGKNADGEPAIENKSRVGYRVTLAIEIVGQNVTSSDGNQSSKPSQVLPTATRRRFLSLATVALVVLTIGVVGYFAMRGGDGIDPQGNQRTLNFQRITDTGDASFPALSPDGNYVGYSRRDEAIFIKDLRNQSESKLEISNVKKFGVLQFSRDSEMLYLRDSASFAEGASVQRVSRFGGTAQSVAVDVWSGFSLSPDEKQIAFVRVLPSENRQVVIVRGIADATEREIISVNSPFEFYLRTFPSWSSDGKQLVMAVNQQNGDFHKLVVADLDDGKTSDLILKNFWSVSQVVWHPRRNSLILAAREAKNSQLWEVMYPEDRINRLTNDLNTYLSPRISEDGSKILVTEGILFSNVWLFEGDSEGKRLTSGRSNLDGYRGIASLSNGHYIYTSDEGKNSSTNLWTVDPTGTERRQLTVNAGTRNENPVVSSDDKYIYFSSNRGGKLNIWRIDTNGENPTQIVTGDNAVNAYPQLSIDGEWIYFIRNAGNSSAIWRQSLTSDRSEKVTDEAVLSPTGFLSISPDGTRLAFQNLAGSRSDAPGLRPKLQVAILATADSTNVSFLNFDSRQIGIAWTPDSRSILYVVPKKEKDEIWRQNIDQTSEAQLERTIAKESVYSLVAARDGKTIALSIGQISYNPIMITDF